MSQYRIFIGLPGVGKSTLINCLEQRIVFKSGYTCEEAIKDWLQKKKQNNITYLEIPITNDAKWIKVAIERTKDVIKQNVYYQIFFVITAESRRISEKDINAIQLILESNENITSYNLIMNKLSKYMYKELLCNDNRLKLAFSDGNQMQPESTLLLLHDEDLFEAENGLKRFKELEKFVENTTYLNAASAVSRKEPGNDTLSSN